MQFISLILLLILNIYSDASQRNTEEFDWSLTKEVLNNECSTGQKICNVMLSPFVTKLSLSLFRKAIAANSESDKELSILLLDLNRYYEMVYWQNTLGSLKEKNESNSLLMGSLIGLAKGASIDSSYELEAFYLFNTKVKTYDSDAEQATFQNTIYFKAEWDIEFETIISKSQKEETMYGYGSFSWRKSEKLNSNLRRINYKGGKYAMIIIDPKNYVALQHVINNLDVQTLKDEISKMKEGFGTDTFPTFKFESSFGMAKHIKNLGSTKIFTPEANIQRINSSGPALEVTDVVQNFVIEVNKDGTEAYGVMDMGIMNKMDKRAKSINTTTIKPPFLFCIIDVTTDVVLFSGKVMNHKYSN